MRKLIFTALLLTACGPTDRTPPEGPSPQPPFLGLQAYFDCMGEKGLTQIAAHRGGPVPGYPENALPTFKRTIETSGTFLEVDVATSADGVLFLHHDDNLGRTTTGKGRASDFSWSKLKDLSLKDNNGRVTAYGLTRLDEALEWADGKAILELDIKRSTDYDDVARIVRDANAEDRVVLIAYTENSAVALAKRLPNTMISVTVKSTADVQSLTDRGLRAENIIAWTGTETPDSELNEMLQREGIESIFGTLGGRDSIDNQIEMSGAEGRYAELSEIGVELIATDRPEAAAASLRSAGRLASPASCISAE